MNEWRKKYPSLTATPSPPGMPQGIFCLNVRSSIPTCSYPLWTVRQAQTPSNLLPVHLEWEPSPPCTLRSCLRVAVSGGAVRQGRPGVGREPVFGSQRVRIPEDLCLAHWDGLCLLCAGAVPQRRRRTARIVATAARSASRCSRVSQRHQNPEAGSPAPRLVRTSRSLGAAGYQPRTSRKVGGRGAVPGAEVFADYVSALPQLLLSR
ncbi:hypothetical protein NN561_010379 [Cricetulus griseus]